MVGGDFITTKSATKKKISPFEQELIEVIKTIVEYKTAAEANIVSILFQKPDFILDSNLTLDEFNNNIWKVYWSIATDIIKVEQKASLDDITVGLYLEKHPKLRKKYEYYGGYDTIINAGTYVKEENFDGYVQELRKWNGVIKLAKRGCPVKDRLSDYCDMTSTEIYNEWEAWVNDIFVNVDTSIKTYNGFDGINEYIDELNEGLNVGMPFHNCDLLNKEIGGFNPNGNIYGLGANSGVGKSTTAMDYIIPSVIKYDEKAVFFINEEDEKKVKKELIIWVANNVLKYNLPKHVLRDGNFSDETMKILRETAAWIEEKKENRNITIVPLEHYSVNIVIKLIKKYSSMGVRFFVLDTLKESCDSKTDEIYKSMTRDMVKLYDVVKPSAKNVGLFVTYQLGKTSIKARYYTNNEIGMAKSIVDVMSANLMIRRPFEDEYEGGKREIIGYKLEGKNGKSKIPFKLKRDKHYMITFIPKNRFGRTDAFQIISELDFSTNTNRDIGICNISQDFF